MFRVFCAGRSGCAALNSTKIGKKERADFGGFTKHPPISGARECSLDDGRKMGHSQVNISCWLIGILDTFRNAAGRYSVRRALRGSTLAARVAGMMLAARATVHTPATARK